MPTIQLQAQLSPDDLLNAVGQLGPAEWDQFVLRVLTLRARRLRKAALLRGAI